MYHVTPLDIQKICTWVMVLGIWVSSRFHSSLVVVVGPKSIFGLYENGYTCGIETGRRKVYT